MHVVIRIGRAIVRNPAKKTLPIGLFVCLTNHPSLLGGKSEALLYEEPIAHSERGGVVGRPPSIISVNPISLSSSCIRLLHGV